MDCVVWLRRASHWLVPFLITTLPAISHPISSRHFSPQLFPISHHKSSRHFIAWE
jgi:hypothetical protein